MLMQNSFSRLNHLYAPESILEQDVHSLLCALFYLIHLQLASQCAVDDIGDYESLRLCETRSHTMGCLPPPRRRISFHVSCSSIMRNGSSNEFDWSWKADKIVESTHKQRTRILCHGARNDEDCRESQSDDID